MLDHVIGVLCFNGAKYREIAKDKSATIEAGIIIALALIIEGFISGFIEVNNLAGTVSANMVMGISRAVAVLVSGLIAWVVAAWVIAFVVRFLGGETNMGEMLRVTGYVAVFGLISFLSFLALPIPSLGFIAEIILFIVAFLEFFAYLLGISKVAEISVHRSFFAVIVAAIINLPIIILLTSLILRALRISAV